MINSRRIILVPLDNRPITCLFPQLLARSAGIDALLPPRSMLGASSSKEPVNVEALSVWLENTLKEVQPGGLAICLDSLLYGGLVASRRSDVSMSTLGKRVASIARWKKIADANLKVMAQSSIMRISDNYFSSEEMPYWSKYGREIFHWSELFYKKKHGLLNDAIELTKTEEKIENEVRSNYLATRKRNFEINLKLIESARLKNIDFLILSQDDTGKFGLNVLEKEELQSSFKQKGLSNVRTMVGTDEILMLLLSRWLVDNSQRRPSCSIYFNLEQNRITPSNYEGQTMEESVKAQIDAAALEMGGEDFAIIVHASNQVQGDHIFLPGLPDRRVLNTTHEVEKTVQLLEIISAPCVICDVAYSNGSDPLLVEQLIRRKDLMDKLWGYAGWNTSSNTIGSALAMGVARWYAQQQHAGVQAGVQTIERSDNCVDNLAKTSAAFKQAMFVRFADDWAYQTQVRPKIEKVSNEDLTRLMSPYLQELATVFDLEHANVRCSFPWQRTFEVEIDIDA